MVLLTTAVLLAASPQAILQIQSRENREQSQNYRIDFKYPEIANARHFNAAVQQILNPVMDAFRKNAVPIQAPCDRSAYLNGHYTASILKTGIVSVLLEWSQDTPCAVHPYGGMTSINYDDRAGRVLVLSDLFQPGAHYLSRLSQLAIAS